MTKQELFNKSMAGLAAQGWKPGMTTGDSFASPVCSYMTPDGLRCAIGHLLDEEAARAAQVEQTHLHDILKKAGLLGHNMFLRTLQEEHDNAGLAGQDLRMAMIQFAATYGLTFPADL